MQFGLVFWWLTLEGTSGVLIFDLVQILKYMKKWNKRQKRNVFPCLARPDDHNLNGCGKLKEDGNFAPFHFSFFCPTMARGPHQPQWFGKVKGNGNWGLRPTIWCQSWHSEMVQFWDGTILRWHNFEMVQYVHFIKIVAKEHFGRKNSLSFNKMWQFKNSCSFFVLGKLFPINSSYCSFIFLLAYCSGDYQNKSSKAAHICALVLAQIFLLRNILWLARLLINVVWKSHNLKIIP